jgi:hypothetical protein
MTCVALVFSFTLMGMGTRVQAQAPAGHRRRAPPTLPPPHPYGTRTPRSAGSHLGPAHPTPTPLAPHHGQRKLLAEVGVGVGVAADLVNPPDGVGSPFLASPHWNMAVPVAAAPKHTPAAPMMVPNPPRSRG